MNRIILPQIRRNRVGNMAVLRHALVTDSAAEKVLGRDHQC
jgi:hypothetical protein